MFRALFLILSIYCLFFSTNSLALKLIYSSTGAYENHEVRFISDKISEQKVALLVLGCDNCPRKLKILENSFISTSRNEKLKVSDLTLGKNYKSHLITFRTKENSLVEIILAN